MVLYSLCVVGTTLQPCLIVLVAFPPTGTGDGADKWIIEFEGGGWCYNETDCVERSKGRLGSSKSWPKTASYEGLLSANKEINPDFYDWNLAFLNYCDGASFAGNVLVY